MNLVQFITTYTGEAVSYDGIKANDGQCEQLVCLYWQKVFGFKCPPIPGALGLWTNSIVLSNFKRVPIGQEQPGDVCVWGASNIINSPIYGHTDIVISPGFLGFDSNWGGVNNAQGYPVAHEVQHNYADALGFLRYNVGMTPTEQAQLTDALNYKNGVINSNGWISNVFSEDTTKITSGINLLINTVAELENDRDTNLYPFINAICAGLDIPNGSNMSTAINAINALKNTAIDKASVLNYVNKNLN